MRQGDLKLDDLILFVSHAYVIPSRSVQSTRLLRRISWGGQT
jgi:hypothetical protein